MEDKVNEYRKLFGNPTPTDFQKHIDDCWEGCNYWKHQNEALGLSMVAESLVNMVYTMLEVYEGRQCTYTQKYVNSEKFNIDFNGMRELLDNLEVEATMDKVFYIIAKCGFLHTYWRIFLIIHENKMNKACQNEEEANQLLVQVPYSTTKKVGDKFLVLDKKGILVPPLNYKKNQINIQL